MYVFVLKGKNWLVGRATMQTSTCGLRLFASLCFVHQFALTVKLPVGVDVVFFLFLCIEKGEVSFFFFEIFFFFCGETGLPSPCQKRPSCKQAEYKESEGLFLNIIYPLSLNLLFFFFLFFFVCGSVPRREEGTHTQKPTRSDACGINCAAARGVILHGSLPVPIDCCYNHRNGTKKGTKKDQGGIICCCCLLVIVATNSSPVAVAAAVTTTADFSLFFCDHISQSGACQHLLTLCGADTAIANSSFTLTR
ncbi:hypothetical protein TCSYLVIO_003612 [Trypanosoma cruzi]|nr:hypothetical protein TCSYLVIO_003612 [Trypanosoma cruzi]